MPTIEEDGLTISYGEAGEGSVLVLLHAAGSTGRNGAACWANWTAAIIP